MTSQSRCCCCQQVIMTLKGRSLAWSAQDRHSAVLYRALRRSLDVKMRDVLLVQHR